VLHIYIYIYIYIYDISRLRVNICVRKDIEVCTNDKNSLKISAFDIHCGYIKSTTLRSKR